MLNLTAKDKVNENHFTIFKVCTPSTHVFIKAETESEAYDKLCKKLNWPIPKRICTFEKTTSLYLPEDEEIYA